MADFVFIFLIFLEIFLTVFLVRKIVALKKRIVEIDEVVKSAHEPIIAKIKEFRAGLKKVNKVFSFVTNKKFMKIKQILTIAFEVGQIIILIKSFKFKKGLKLDFSALKGLVFVETFKIILKKLLFILKSCAV